MIRRLRPRRQQSCLLRAERCPSAIAYSLGLEADPSAGEVRSVRAIEAHPRGTHGEYTMALRFSFPGKSSICFLPRVDADPIDPLGGLRARQRRHHQALAAGHGNVQGKVMTAELQHPGARHRGLLEKRNVVEFLTE